MFIVIVVSILPNNSPFVSPPRVVSARANHLTSYHHNAIDGVGGGGGGSSCDGVCVCVQYLHHHQHDDDDDTIPVMYR